MSNEVEVTFYHFTSVPLLKGVPSLLKKIYDTKKNVLLLCKDEEEVEELDKFLWSFSTKIFLPHGTEKDEEQENQPIFLSTKIMSVNDPKVILSFIDISDKEMENFESVIFVFFGNKKDTNVLDMYKRFNEIKDRKKMQAKFWSQELSTGKWQQIQ
jgi:DNA polymerase-3 subunit chi